MWSGIRTVRRGDSPRSDERVALRRFPYPYRAAATICSDIDATRTVERFLAIQEFLNSAEETPMGPGLGLEIGNSFFPYPEDDGFGFFCSRRRDREVIEAMIDSGYIDCMHSWGHSTRTRREQVLRGLEELERSGCRVQVWVDHSRAPTNFGKDTTAGVGDVEGSPFYHSDATLAYGVRFAWMGRGSAIVGQGVPLSVRGFAGIVDRSHPRGAAQNLVREAGKTVLGRAGVERFALHADNRFMRVHTLMDGRRVCEFQRCNAHWSGARGANSGGLAYALRPEVLEALVRSGGTMVAYTHLGVGPQEPPYLQQETRDALRRLATAHRAGRIFVTTTSRLLTYHVNHKCLIWSHETSEAGETVIHIRGVGDPFTGRHVPPVEALQGITFYVPDSGKARLVLGGRELTRIERHPADETGRASVAIPRSRMRYPLAVS